MGRSRLSLGSDRLLAVSLNVAPVRAYPRSRRGLLDLSFIPLYRDVDGVTGYARWCPEWLRRRDLVLAGRAEEALAGSPERFGDIRPTLKGFDCPGQGWCPCARSRGRAGSRRPQGGIER